jgi:hypothetical protein
MRGSLLLGHVPAAAAFTAATEHLLGGGLATAATAAIHKAEILKEFLTNGVMNCEPATAEAFMCGMMYTKDACDTQDDCVWVKPTLKEALAEAMKLGYLPRLDNAVTRFKELRQTASIVLDIVQGNVGLNCEASEMCAGGMSFGPVMGADEPEPLSLIFAVTFYEPVWTCRDSVACGMQYGKEGCENMGGVCAWKDPTLQEIVDMLRAAAAMG